MHLPRRKKWDWNDVIKYSRETGFRIPNLKDYFTEFKKYSPDCKFSDCLHISPKFCAVCKALENGGIASSRYNNYINLYKILKDKKEWK